MKARNHLIMRKGYAPAHDVATATTKALSTIHRLADAGAFEVLRDGRALYVKLASAEAYFRAEGVAPLGDAIAKLARTVAKEVFPA